MRDPARPPEPMPIAGPLPEGNDDTFVIQEHHARALHWYVRLERDGVLVSWAVPKALPLSSKDNRLAVHTEDHPIDYGTFEGEIPAGEYGGGHVILRDRGRYELEKWTDREVKVVLHGSRTEGRYVFFQIRGRAGLDGAPDGRAAVRRLGAAADRSAADAGDAGTAAERRTAAVGVRARLGREPHPGRGRGWPHPDHRRRRPGRQRAYPELRAMGVALGATVCLLDGEVVVLGKDGRPDAALLARRPARSAAPGAKDAREAPISFLAVDLVHRTATISPGSPTATDARRWRTRLGRRPLEHHAVDSGHRTRRFT
jgi:bifunctional non-homologous end joining protein LigD